MQENAASRPLSGLSMQDQKGSSTLKDKEKSLSTPRISRLDRVGGVSSELAKLYREARKGEIEPYTATRLASVLVALRGSLEASTFEARLDALEARFAAGERP